MEDVSRLAIEDRVLTRKLLYEVEEALKELKSHVDKGVRYVAAHLL